MARLTRQQEDDLRKEFRGLVRKTKEVSSSAKSNNKSIKWFKDTVMKSLKTHTVTKPKVGRLYSFAYDAKHKKTLPYFDRFPLSVCIAVANDRWYSINLHYLPVSFRTSFLEELLVRYANNRTLSRGSISNSTHLKIDWGKIKNFNPRVFEHALTSYLPHHMKSSLNEINPKEWHLAANMPSQQFVSYESGKHKRYSAQKVWSRF